MWVETPVDCGLSESLSLVKGRSCHSYTNHLTAVCLFWADCSHLLIKLMMWCGIMVWFSNMKWADFELPFSIFVKHFHLVLCCTFFSFFFFTYENDKPLILNYVFFFPPVFSSCVKSLDKIATENVNEWCIRIYMNSLFINSPKSELSWKCVISVILALFV